MSSTPSPLNPNESTPMNGTAPIVTDVVPESNQNRSSFWHRKRWILIAFMHFCITPFTIMLAMVSLPTATNVVPESKKGDSFWEYERVIWILIASMHFCITPFTIMFAMASLGRDDIWWPGWVPFWVVFFPTLLIERLGLHLWKVDDPWLWAANTLLWVACAYFAVALARASIRAVRKRLGFR